VITLGAVPLAPYATTGTMELSESLEPFIPYHDAILMANHGVVTYGEDLPGLSCGWKRWSIMPRSCWPRGSWAVPGRSTVANWKSSSPFDHGTPRTDIKEIAKIGHCQNLTIAKTEDCGLRKRNRVRIQLTPSLDLQLPILAFTSFGNYSNCFLNCAISCFSSATSLCSTATWSSRTETRSASADMVVPADSGGGSQASTSPESKCA